MRVILTKKKIVIADCGAAIPLKRSQNIVDTLRSSDSSIESIYIVFE